MFGGLSSMFGGGGAGASQGGSMASGASNWSGSVGSGPGQVTASDFTGSTPTAGPMTAPTAVSYPVSKDGVTLTETGYGVAHGYQNPTPAEPTPPAPPEKPADWNSGWRGGVKGLAVAGGGGGGGGGSSGATGTSLERQAALSPGAHVSKFGFTPVGR